MHQVLSKAPKTRTQRAFVSWHILVVLAVIAGVLLFVQRRRSAGEVELATGPANAAQKEFIEQSARRPDLALFYKDLTPTGRIRLAENLGRQGTASAAKMATTLLATFDETARSALTDALGTIAKKDPKLVAAELGRTGSFELQGLFEALNRAFPTSIPAAAEAIADPTRRANAIRFLVEGAQDPDRAPAWTAAVGSAVVPMLEADDAGVRAAAAETLGKLRMGAAVEPLRQKLGAAEGEERTAILAALADIGDPRSEDLLMREVAGKPIPSPRILAGLGRMATDGALSELAGRWETADSEARAHVVAGLVLAGDRGLTFVRDPALKLQIAAKLDSPEASRVIRRSLTERGLTDEAIRASKNRPELADALWQAGMSAGDPTVPARFAALATTAKGRAVLTELKSDGALGGLAQRALALAEP